MTNQLESPFRNGKDHDASRVKAIIDAPARPVVELVPPKPVDLDAPKVSPVDSALSDLIAETEGRVPDAVVINNPIVPEVDENGAIEMALENYKNFRSEYLKVVDENRLVRSRLDAELVVSENLRSELKEVRDELHLYMRMATEAFTNISNIGILCDKAKALVAKAVKHES